MGKRQCVSYSRTTYQGYRRVGVRVIGKLLARCTHFIRVYFTAPGFAFSRYVGLGQVCSASRSLPPLNPPRVSQPTSLSLSFNYSFAPRRVRDVITYTGACRLFYISMHVRSVRTLFTYGGNFSVHIGGVHHIMVLFSTLLRGSLVRSQ